MSYMNQAAFAPTGGIQELSFDEIDLVEGGTLSPGTKAAVRLVDWAPGVTLVGGIVLGIAVEAVIYYTDND